ncbi:hypothetical protein CPB86DRAFT_602107 [Serendipita vermifera]|nr:hypothetical protein CPB86DRAFT_602107 [Serendipita vermifera]
MSSNVPTHSEYFWSRMDAILYPAQNTTSSAKGADTDQMAYRNEENYYQVPLSAPQASGGQPASQDPPAHIADAPPKNMIPRSDESSDASNKTYEFKNSTSGIDGESHHAYREGMIEEGDGSITSNSTCPAHPPTETRKTRNKEDEEHLHHSEGVVSPQ